MCCKLREGRAIDAPHMRLTSTPTHKPKPTNTQTHKPMNLQTHPDEGRVGGDLLERHRRHVPVGLRLEPVSSIWGWGLVVGQVVVCVGLVDGEGRLGGVG